MSTTATETALERQVREEQEEHDLARNDGGLAANEQLQKEKLFELPPIKHDSTKPTMIHVVVSGPVPLDLSQKADIDFYNELQPGKLVTREVTFYVTGAKKTHRRDSEGNVDAVVETKSLLVDGIRIVD